MAFVKAEWQYQTPVTIKAASIPAAMPDGGESLFPPQLIIENGGRNWEGDAANLFPRVTNYANDIAFTLADESTQLRHTITDWNATGGSELMVAHMGVPSIASAVDTPLIMWSRDDGAADQQQTVYLNADNWVAYWSLQEQNDGLAGGGTVWYDLSDRDNDLADYISATGKTGQVGSGQQFDGSNDYAQAAASASLNLDGAFTISAWVNATSFQTGGGRGARYIRAICGDASDNSGNYSVGLRFGNNTLVDNAKLYGLVKTTAGDQGVQGVTDLSTGTWYRVALTWDGSTLRLYYNGTEDANNGTTGTKIQQNKPWRLSYEYDGRWFHGYEDEVAISSARRSANWLTTTYNCQNDNDAFWAVGSEVAVGPSTFPYYYQMLIANRQGRVA